MVLRSFRAPDGGLSPGARLLALLLVVGLVAALIPTLVPVLDRLLGLLT